MTSPVEVRVVQALQIPDPHVDVVQLWAQVLGLLWVGRDPIQLLQDPLSQTDVLVVEGVQVLAHHLATTAHGMKGFHSNEYTCF